MSAILQVFNLLFQKPKEVRPGHFYNKSEPLYGAMQARLGKADTF